MDFSEILSVHSERAFNDKVGCYLIINRETFTATRKSKSD